METIKLVWAGESMGPVRVDGWPANPRTFKSIGIYADSFVGTLLIEASLATNPTEEDWFTYHVGEYLVHPAPNMLQYQNELLTNRDRVIWMRAQIVKTQYGRLDRVLVL